MRATAKLDPWVREPNRRLSVEQNQCVPATENFPPPLPYFFPHDTLSSSTSTRAVTNPLLSPVLLSQPSPLSLHLSSVSRCESPDIQTRLVMLALASIHHYHSRLRYGSCSLSHFPFLLPSFTFTKTLLTPHGLISSTIFIKVFTLNELDASLHLYCLSWNVINR